MTVTALAWKRLSCLRQLKRRVPARSLRRHSWLRRHRCETLRSVSRGSWQELCLNSCLPSACKISCVTSAGGLGLTSDLSQCINIAIAGTRSTTLHSWLQQRSIHAQHRHVLDTWDKLLLWDRLHGSPHPPRCAIVTWRDPARRLESGTCYDLFTHHKHIRPLAGEAGRFLHPTNARATKTRELIDCLERCGNDPTNGTAPMPPAAIPRALRRA